MVRPSDQRDPAFIAMSHLERKISSAMRVVQARRCPLSKRNQEEKPSLEEYEKLVEERPRKWSAEQVNYRPGDGPEFCKGCRHFYERRLDRFGVCEVFRSKETDEEGVQPNFVCDWWTQDGRKFPLQTS